MWGRRNSTISGYMLGKMRQECVWQENPSIEYRCRAAMTYVPCIDLRAAK